MIKTKKFYNHGHDLAVDRAMIAFSRYFGLKQYMSGYKSIENSKSGKRLKEK
jgi:hypothetical protein